MSVTDGHCSSLNALPSDIIRRMIRAGITSMDEMKLISPRWNNLAHEHLSDRTRLPVMERCWFHFHSTQTEIRINIPRPFYKYFGVHIWLAGYCPTTRSTDYRRFLKTQCILNGTGKAVEQLNQIFARCSKIGNLVLEVGLTDRALITAVKNAVGPVKIGELSVKGELFTNYDNEKVLDFVRFNDVNVLVLSTFTIDCVQTFDTFFIEAALYATKVQFTQREMISVRHDLNAIRNDWERASNWLNETGQVSAVLDEEMESEVGYVQMRITMIKSH